MQLMPSGSEGLCRLLSRRLLLPALVIAASLGAVSPAWAAAPAHDNIINARALPPSLGDTNADATAEAGEPNHAENVASHSVWFRFTAANDGQVQLDTCGSAVDTVLALYTGGPDFSSLTPLDDDDDGGTDGCTPGDSQINFLATAGTIYRIALDGKANATGTYQMTIRDQPGNSDFDDATELQGSSASASGVNFFAGKETGEPDHDDVVGGNSVWFVWTANGNGTAAIDTCFSLFDTLLAVYTGSSVGALTAVPGGSNDDDDTPGCGGGTQSQVSFPVSAGTTYAIAVDGKEGVQGGYSLSLVGPPDNDLFASAQDLGDAPINSGGSNEHAGTEPGEGNHAGVAGGHSVWFTWTANDSGPFVLDICGANFDTLLAVYTGLTLAGKTEIAANDDGAGCGGTGSKLRFQATADTTYRIAVDGKAGAEGSFDLKLAKDNDNFADAALIGGDSASYSGTTAAATTELGEPNHAGVLVRSGSVWFRWTAPVSGEVTAEACAPGNFDPVMAVYTGTAVSALTAVASDDDGDPPNCTSVDSLVSFSATAGTTYHLAVDGKGAGEGEYNLSLAGPPDDVDPGTQILSGPSGATPSPSAAFTYAGDPDFDIRFFHCRLDSSNSGDFQRCPRAGISFSGLADGAHTFEVIAFDFSFNADDTPATRSFTVDTGVPDTSILSGPSGTITTASAGFTYAGSSGGTPLEFQCSLDSAAFASCPNAGTSFTGLADGAHGFAVRALDAAGNVDGSPASRSFTVDTTVDPPPAEDLCTPARDKLKAAKAKLRRTRAADRPDQERIDRLKRKVRKLKAKVAAAC